MTRPPCTPAASFPLDFAWGAATAAYQVEGAWNVDGRGPSVWDDFCHRGGKIADRSTGDVACDHYRLWREDVEMMRTMGLRAYRFSLSWSRILPDGTGRVNEAGLRFYEQLVDALLEAGITPWITLFHWDLPTALYNKGGWLNRDCVEWFGEYTRVVAERLGDRVRHWITLNEPPCFTGIGQLDGVHAPGDRLSFASFLRIAHHVLMAHGRSVQVLREVCPRPVQIGFAITGNARIPHKDTAADIHAAKTLLFSVRRKSQWNMTWWMDPVFLGKYPADGLALFADDMPEVTRADMDLIHQPLDFIGYNGYTGDRVESTPEGPLEIPHDHGHARGLLGWVRMEPAAIYWMTRFLQERYGKLPMAITENGFPSTDWVDLTGRVRDPQRIDYTARYLMEIARANREGHPVAAYFHWTLMDNFEWAEGYHARFGLVHVDFRTQKRTLKDSAYWYRQVIESNGASLAPADEMDKVEKPIATPTLEEVLA
ncbi:beta-glucosidase [Verrucomicrobia bacterium LW23]|nr:beta-glucosidase [Verrucomicrobia bacterium LW23]